jgi:hypothetical protein
VLHPGKGLVLKRYRHVAALQALRMQVVQPLDKTVQGQFYRLVMHKLLGLPGKLLMNPGRLAVVHRMPQHRVALGLRHGEVKVWVCKVLSRR